MSQFFFSAKGQSEYVPLADRVKHAVRRETKKMLLVGAAAMVVQSLFNLAIVLSV